MNNNKNIADEYARRQEFQKFVKTQNLSSN